MVTVPVIVIAIALVIPAITLESTVNRLFWVCLRMDVGRDSHFFTKLRPSVI